MFIEWVNENKSYWLQSFQCAIHSDSISTNNLKSYSVNYFFGKVRYQGTKVLPDPAPFSSRFCSSEKSVYTGKVIQSLSDECPLYTTRSYNFISGLKIILEAEAYRSSS